ncbi:MAG: hypothetical protein H0V17_02250 [Deltaproteobacteria bacterium]|nr:hypothetical protein [Deltaproteobacteria bacterium]
MTETFVDLTYRGLSLGRRIKLSQVRPTTGYLEHPTPMPIGTAVSIATDDGLVFDAVVDEIHEQVGGSEIAPGMRVKPALATEQLAGWWKDRAQDEPAAPERSKPVTVRPRTQTVPESSPASALAAMAAPAFAPAGTRPEITPAMEYAPTPAAPTPAVAFPIHTIPGTLQVPPPGNAPPTTTIPGTVFDPAGAPSRGGSSTTVMNAVDQDLLAQLTRGDDIEQLTRTTGEHAIIDDGMRTSVMDAVDPAALGVDVSMFSASNSVDDEGDDETSAGESGPIGAVGDDKKPKGSGPTKKRKKRR